MESVPRGKTRSDTESGEFIQKSKGELSEKRASRISQVPDTRKLQRNPEGQGSMGTARCSEEARKMHQADTDTARELEIHCGMFSQRYMI